MHFYDTPFVYDADILQIEYNHSSNTVANPCRSLDQDIYRITATLDQYIAPVFIIGIPANIIVFLVFSLQCMSSGVTSLLFKTLAVWDTAVVFINIGLHTIPLRSYQSLVTYSNATCKIVVYMYFICRSMAAWTLVTIGLERVIGVTWPLSAGNICTRSRVITFMICSTLVVAILYCPLAFTISQDTILSNGQQICAIHAELPDYSKAYFFYVEFLISTFFPFIAMMIFNVKIIAVIRRSQRTFASTYQDGRTSHVTPMLLAASAAFVLLRLPCAVFMFLELAFQAQSLSCIHRVIIYLGYASYICDTVNHSINMFLYCVSGRHFRKALFEMIKCVYCRETMASKTGEQLRLSTSTLYMLPMKGSSSNSDS